MEFLYSININIDFNTSKNWLYKEVIKIKMFILIDYSFLS